MSRQTKRYSHLLKEKEKPKNIFVTIRRLIGYLEKYRWKLILAIILLIISTCITVVATRLIGVCIDKYIVTRDWAGLKNAGLRLILLYVTASFLSWMQEYLMIQTAQNTAQKIRDDLFGKMQKLPLRYFDTRPHGETMSRMTNDVDTIATMLNTNLSQVLQSVLTMVTTFAMMLYLSPILTLCVLGNIPILLWTTKKNTKMVRKFFAQRQEHLGKLNGFIEESISGQKAVKVFAKEEEQMVRFTQMNQDLLQSGMKAEIFSGILAPVSTALNNLSYTVIVGVGAVLILIGGNMSLGIISNFMIYSKQFSRPIQELANQMSTLLSAVAGAERVFEVLDAEEEVQDEKDAMELTEVKGNVHFSNVSFSYIEGQPVLKNIEIQAKQGQTIALVGPTGAGKTTIMNLLMRFYDTEEGTVFVEGKDIRKIKRSNLREQMGMVLQDTYLFSGTVEENIKYGKQDATQEEVEYAAKLANAHDFISRLPQGYQTTLGDGGGNLSQGQRQMISIARVMLNNPKILILDEATSSIDTQTEQKIQEAMNVLMQGRTNFVIAHRLSTIRNADKIAVIQHGELKEMGTHQELLDKKGVYYQMYFSQFQDV